MAKEPSILFLSHAASRTGAPKVVLGLVQWLKEQTSWNLRVMVGEGGGLLEEFQAVAETTVYEEWEWGVPRPLPQRMVRKMGLAYREDFQQHPLHRIYPEGSIDLIYANTTLSAFMLQELAYLKVPIISHIHELEYAIRHNGGPENWERVTAQTDHYIAASDAVRRCLVETMGLPSEDVSLVYETSPDLLLVERPKTEALAEIRRNLGLSGNDFIVGACGASGWHKGGDLLVPLAMAVNKLRPDARVHFIWLGADPSRPETDQLKHDVVRAGLSEQVHVVGKVPEVLPYMSLFSVFCMLSREDSFPLVNLEAGRLGIPIVCFRGGGGTEEFVRGDAGHIVPYLDVPAMAEALVGLMEHPEKRIEMGGIASTRAKEEFSCQRIYGQLREVIQRCLPATMTPSPASS